ncbi:hypothetical protein CC78DRAFT_595976 [Lojkania enalia]|uniref:Uncharacterized protein n=1 Tax=Lojkania enalia TaxID=147567 RepID=A0A9P4NBW0_9PLEO|nr:hypothetical protein CC78DRAFT_595976 [Didymosphaeria enalia]
MRVKVYRTPGGAQGGRCRQRSNDGARKINDSVVTLEEPWSGRQRVPTKTYRRAVRSGSRSRDFVVVRSASGWAACSLSYWRERMGRPGASRPCTLCGCAVCLCALEPSICAGPRACVGCAELVMGNVIGCDRARWVALVVQGDWAKGRLGGKEEESGLVLGARSAGLSFDARAGSSRGPGEHFQGSVPITGRRRCLFSFCARTPLALSAAEGGATRRFPPPARPAVARPAAALWRLPAVPAESEQSALSPARPHT